jgi:hypothetical protein
VPNRTPLGDSARLPIEDRLILNASHWIHCRRPAGLSWMIGNHPMTPLPWVLASIWWPSRGPLARRTRLAFCQETVSQSPRGKLRAQGRSLFQIDAGLFWVWGSFSVGGDWQLHWKIKHNVQALRTTRSAKATNLEPSAGSSRNPQNGHRKKGVSGVCDQPMTEQFHMVKREAENGCLYPGFQRPPGVRSND